MGMWRSRIVVATVVISAFGAFDGRAAWADEPPPPLPPPAPLCTPGANPISGLATAEKVVTFTFDDGPSTAHTRAILDAFETRGLRATFFVLGNAARYRAALAAEIVARGHEIGNHSRTHSYGGPTNVNEMPQAQQQIEAASGVRPTFFRMPGLSWKKSVVTATGRNGLCAIDTNFIVGDWRVPRASASVLCTRFKKGLRPGSLVVLHDGGTSHRQTVAAMPCMLDHAIAQGYRVLPLREFLGLATSGLASLTYRKVK